MTQEEEKYYEHYFNMFSTDGWKQLVEEIQESINAYRIEDIKDDKALFTTQGELTVLQRIAFFETTIRNAYDHTLEYTDVSEV